jgi:hypothetical protein
MFTSEAQILRRFNFDFQPKLLEQDFHALLEEDIRTALKIPAE